jgi:leucyl/phenylalanyl-tRNA--protein transferase
MTEFNDTLADSLAPISMETPEEPGFRERWTDRLRRWALGLAYALRPKRIGILPRMTLMTLQQATGRDSDWDRLPENPTYYSWRGLVGVSDDLSVEALLRNYRRGYFPFCHMGPMKWWSPDTRAVMDPAELHVGKNLKRLLRQHQFQISFDQDFAAVMEACARPRDGKVPLTWITPRIMQAFYEAHRAGYAHSVEVRDDSGALVGGLYGLALGQVFFGESQFHHAEHMSKVAMVALHRHLAAWGFRLRDAKWMTPHLQSYGFYEVPRAEFLGMLDLYADQPGMVGRWRADPTLDLAGPTVLPARATPKAMPRARPDAA